MSSYKLAFAALCAVSSTVLAQSEFLGIPGGAYLDNIADSSAIRAGSSYVPASILGAEAPEGRWLPAKRFSVGYQYSRTTYDRSNDDADAHSVSPELYLESEIGLALNMGFGFTRQDPSSGLGFEKDIYTFSAQPAQDLWRLFCPDDKKTQLWLGFGMGVSETDSQVRSIITVIDTEAETFFIAPNLVCARQFTDRITGILAPAYSMAWTTTDFSPGEVDSESGLFSLTGRADIAIMEDVTISGFAIWKRDILMDIDVPRYRAPESEDWGEFGASIRWAIGGSLGLRAGYSYEAFHSFFEQHKVIARLELGF